jgi:formylglycine-generating enzyme required for sulfatase activity
LGVTDARQESFLPPAKTWGPYLPIAAFSLLPSSSRHAFGRPAHRAEHFRQMPVEVECVGWGVGHKGFNDDALVSTEVGKYKPNAWGLHNMHGSVWQWTRSAYRRYLYRDDDGRNQPGVSDRRVVRDGSWYDRPSRCRSGFRLSYPAWQKVYNVGFRIVCDLREQQTLGAHVAK